MKNVGWRTSIMKYTIFYRKSLVLLVASIALLTAPTGFVAGSVAEAAGAGHEYSDEPATRPWNGTWSGVTTINGNCANGGLLGVDSGTGQAEHMGSSTHLSAYCLDPVTLTGSGIGVETAANGDELYFRLTLRITVTSAGGGIWMEAETVIGGTGRFAGATGRSTSSGTFTFTSPTTTVWEGTHMGTLTY
jgi:hypothetical protein